MKYFFVPFIIAAQLIIFSRQATSRDLADKVLGTDAQPKECRMSERFKGPIDLTKPAKTIANCKSFSSVVYPEENYRTFTYIFSDGKVVVYTSRLQIYYPADGYSKDVDIYVINKVVFKGKELEPPTGQHKFMCAVMIEGNAKQVLCDLKDIQLSYQTLVRQ
jgi:hypothetical protein